MKDLAFWPGSQLRTAGESVRNAWSGLPGLLEKLFLAAHPRTVRKRALALSHTYYLGTANVCLWLVLFGSGLLLLFHVRPSVPQIYRDVQDLQFTVSHGGFIRNLHRVAAGVTVVTVFLHMLRVFFHRAYTDERRWTWIVGMGLLLTVLGSSYTGYLLPWDQRAYWGVAVGTSMAQKVPAIGEHIRVLMLGGNTIGPEAVVRFYVVHCFILPLATMLLIAGHLWRVRRLGVHGPGERRQAVPVRLPTERRLSLLRPAATRDEEEEVPSYPALLIRQVMVLQWIVIGLSLVALLAGAPPLEEIANPLETPDVVKAPWYLVGLQELLHYLPAIVVGVVLPGLVVSALFLVPFNPFNRQQVPLWSWPTPLVVRGLAALTLVVTAALVLIEAWVVLVPTLAMEALLLWSRGARARRGLRAWLRQRTISEWLMIWFAVVAVVVTSVGQFFRGPGWSLVWPGSGG